MLWHNPLIDLFISFIGLIFIAQGAAKNALVYTENTRWLAQQHHWLAIASLLREGAGESERERGGRGHAPPSSLSDGPFYMCLIFVLHLFYRLLFVFYTFRQYAHYGTCFGHLLDMCLTCLGLFGHYLDMIWKLFTPCLDIC